MRTIILAVFGLMIGQASYGMDSEEVSVKKVNTDGFKCSVRGAFAEFPGDNVVNLTLPSSLMAEGALSGEINARAVYIKTEPSTELSVIKSLKISTDLLEINGQRYAATEPFLQVGGVTHQVIDSGTPEHVLKFFKNRNKAL